MVNSRNEPGAKINIEAGAWVRNAVEKDHLFEAAGLSATLHGHEWVGTGAGDMPFFDDFDFIDQLKVEELDFPVRDTERHIAVGALKSLVMMAMHEEVFVARSGLIVPATKELTGEKLVDEYSIAEFWKTAGCTFDLSNMQEISAVRAMIRRVQDIAGLSGSVPRTLTLPLRTPGEPPDGLSKMYENITDLSGGLVMSERFEVHDTFTSNNDRLRARVADHVPIMGEYSVLVR